jgi:beta-lactamase class A
MVSTVGTGPLLETLAQIRKQFSGTMGIAARNITSGETVELDATRGFPTASVFKIPVMVEVYRQAKLGQLSMDERLTLDWDDPVPGSGVLRDLAPGLNPTVRDLTMLMIIVSDNTATNMLIDRVGGVAAINRTMHEDFGFDSIIVRNRIDFDRIGNEGRHLAEASPHDLMELMTLLAREHVVSPEASSDMLAILKRQHYLNQVPRYVDYNPYGPELDEPQPLWVACKTGALSGVRADAGLIGTDDGAVTFAYAVMTEGSYDTGFSSDNESEIAIGAVGRALLTHWWPADRDAGPPVLSPTSVNQFF